MCDDDVAGEPPKKDSFKTFDFTPGEEYFLYTKQGYESMACVKSATQFEAECILGNRVQETDLVEAERGVDYNA